MAFNFGAFVGALGAGFLIKFLPYWHLMLAGLLLHTLGYILYAVTTHGWLILISKLLSGLFIGMEMTIALAYFAENSVNYQAALKEMGKDKRTISGLRGKLFALDNIAVNIGYLLGPGKYGCSCSLVTVHNIMHCNIYMYLQLYVWYQLYV